MKKLKKYKVSLLLICSLVIYFITLNIIILHSNNDEVLKTDQAVFISCTDGDTVHLEIAGEEKTVRLLAIDTPETVKPGDSVQPIGKEASEYTCKTIKNAKEIILEYEVNNRNDKYGRILAWLFVDGNLLQQELVEKGLAKVAYLYGDYKYTELLQSIEFTARDNQIGLWQEGI